MAPATGDERMSPEQWLTIALLMIGNSAAGVSAKTIAEMVFRVCLVSLAWIAAIGTLQ
jgi:hypothetical protein